MKITAKADYDQLQNVDVSISITLNIAQWVKITEALDKGKDGFYGVAIDLRDNITKTITNIQKQVTEVYQPKQ